MGRPKDWQDFVGCCLTTRLLPVGGATTAFPGQDNSDTSVNKEMSNDNVRSHFNGDPFDDGCPCTTVESDVVEVELLQCPDTIGPLTLKEAIQGSFIKRALELVESRLFDVNDVDDEDEPYLCQTLISGQGNPHRVTLIRKLLEHGADINATEPTHGRTLLMKSFEYHDLDVIDMLLADPWMLTHDFEATDIDGESALSIAVRFRCDWCTENLPVFYIRKLLEQQASVKHRNIDNYQPLDIAVRFGDIKAAEVLLEYGAPIRTAPRPACLESPLLVCAVHNNIEMARLLLRAGGRVNADRYVAETPLYVALKNRHIDVVEIFVESGCCLSWEPYLVDLPLDKHIQRFVTPRVLLTETELACRLRAQAATTVPLKKQCRSVIWRYFKDNKLSPNTVKKLEIPRTLMDYLLLTS